MRIDTVMVREIRDLLTFLDNSDTPRASQVIAYLNGLLEVGEPPERFTEKNASALLTGDRIVNLGIVENMRVEGAFVHVDISIPKWSPTTGVHIWSVESRFFHSTDELLVEVD